MQAYMELNEVMQTIKSNLRIEMNWLSTYSQKIRLDTNCFARIIINLAKIYVHAYTYTCDHKSMIDKTV